MGLLFGGEKGVTEMGRPVAVNNERLTEITLASSFRFA
jgi:hypothetical protein